MKSGQEDKNCIQIVICKTCYKSATWKTKSFLIVLITGICSFFDDGASNSDRVAPNYWMAVSIEPITSGPRSKARNVFTHSNTGVLDSNPIRGMDVSVRLFCVCVVLYR
jgi:hypothetical protein